jgi:hypothetical protein
MAGEFSLITVITNYSNNRSYKRIHRICIKPRQTAMVRKEGFIKCSDV